MIIIIPGWLIALLTFPGVVVHEIGHRLLCDWVGVTVYDIYYFRIFSKVAGCVIHEPTQNLKKALCIVFGPLFLNTIMCIILTLPIGLVSFMASFYGCAFPLQYFFIYIPLAWAGITIGMHAFPSKQDLTHIKELIPLHRDKKLRFGSLWLLYLIMRMVAFLGVLLGFLYALFISALFSGIVFLIINLISFCF